MNTENRSIWCALYLQITINDQQQMNTATDKQRDNDANEKKLSTRNDYE